jgi:hypothetical protein
MNINAKTINGFFNFVRQISAYVGVALTTTNQLHLPASVRSTLLGASSLLLCIEHLNFAQTKGTATAEKSTGSPSA